ncbi:type VI secretion system transmembrane protein TssO [Spirosoma taeanense]|uniref:Type VI secretion system transmembrane protein TssO n=1 Tax=Spirosoma taeanense TaxID=2735870 RepID=A0A6M5YCB5_9BACT|nr:type VI secretion system TssO [Spirosoma taeanense]QJW91629.1 type VI secretion system transmembrane protein TssO [Spirosoma taeanense]
MNTFFRLAMRERRLQFLYLLTAISLLTLLVSLIVFRHQAYSRTEANYLSNYIRGKEQMLKSQMNNLSLLDSAYRAIVAYKPEVNAIFVEVDIEEQLNEIRRLSAPQADGTRFRAFAQIADFYKMMYDDKKVAWSKQSNISLFQKQLDDCSVGLFPGSVTATPVPATSNSGHR